MSGASLSITGSSEAMAGIERLLQKANDATRRGVEESLVAINRQAQINSTGRPGPNIRSGRHHGSFMVDGPRSLGLGVWEGSCGPTMRYSRALELGHPRWPSGTRFPYLGPAVTFCNRVVIPQIMQRTWAQAMVL